LMSQRRYEDVYQLLRTRNEDPVVAIVRGQAATATGRYAEALASFALANKALPTMEEAALRYAQELLVQGKRAEVRVHIEDAVARFPKSARLRYLKTRMDIDERGILACRAEIEALVALAPKVADTRSLLEALAIFEGKAAPGPRDFASQRWNGIWEDFLLELPHKQARFFGTSDALLRYALEAAPAEGLTLEFGVFYGLSLSILAQHTKGTVDGFDSFQGLPEPWIAGEGVGAYTTNGRRPEVASNVRLHDGWFADTVAPFIAQTSTPVRFAHIDCDLYSSTATVLAAIKKNLTPGSVLVFDDFLGFPGAREHEFKAWNEFAAANSVKFEYIGFVLLDRAAAVAIR